MDMWVAWILCCLQERILFSNLFVLKIRQRTFHVNQEMCFFHLDKSAGSVFMCRVEPLDRRDHTAVVYLAVEENLGWFIIYLFIYFLSFIQLWSTWLWKRTCIDQDLFFQLSQFGRRRLSLWFQWKMEAMEAWINIRQAQKIRGIFIKGFWGDWINECHCIKWCLQRIAKATQCHSLNVRLLSPMSWFEILHFSKAPSDYLDGRLSWHSDQMLVRSGVYVMGDLFMRHLSIGGKA